MRKTSKPCRWLALLIAVTMLAMCLAACSKDEPNTPDNQGSNASQDNNTPDDANTPGAPEGVKTGGTMVMGQGAEPLSLNPDGKPDDNIPNIAQNIFQRLVKTNNNQEVILDLATGYTVSEDGMTYTFTLPDNVRFHDGEPLTSDDVKFTFDEIKAQTGLAAPTLTCIEEITCPDDTTVVFQLNTPNAGFLGVLAYNGTFILPRHVYEGKDWIDADSMMTPVGSGPFKFEEWNKGVSISMVRNEDYYLGPELPYLDRIIFSYISDATTAVQSFYNGDLDVLGIIAPSSDIDRMMGDDKYTLDYVVYPSRFYVGFNFNDELMANHDFRMALAYGIDSDDMINKAMKTVGMKSTQWISPVFEWAVNYDADATVPAFDLEKAKEYMEKTGLTPDANGTYLKVTVDTYNYEPFPDMALVLKDQLAKIGVEVNINMLEYAAWEEKIAAGDFTMVLSGGYQGPDVSAVGMRLETNGVLNYYGYSNAELDALLADAAAQPTQELQAPIYKQAQVIMNQDMPQVLISEWLGYIPYHSYVKGHPASADAVEKTAFGEFTYTWLDK